MIELSEESEAKKTRDVRKVRRVATGILAGLTLIYVGSFFWGASPTWLLLIRAMAEAGMVGGLADWFAVEALFRHPLGLRIPHTALLPRNQKRAARNIARFIDEHFLAPDQLVIQIRKLNPAHMLAEWLAQPDNARAVAQEFSQVLHLVVKSQIRAGLGRKAVDGIRDVLVNSTDSEALARRIAELLRTLASSDVLDEILLEVRRVLDGNRDRLRDVVEDHSRWWIASTVDERIAKLLGDGFLSILDELSDRDSDLRREFDSSIKTFIDSFRDTGRIAAYIDQGKLHHTRSDAFNETVASLVASVLETLDHNLEEHPDRVGALFAEAIGDLAALLLSKPSLEQDLNARLITGIERTLGKVRPAIVEYITRVISDWDSKELVYRLEMEVGRDLQFIRINGAVLGAFVGGVLFIFSYLAKIHP